MGIRSMTGFSKIEFWCGGHEYVLEMMSLNSKFIDVSVFVYNGSLELEHRIRKAVTEKIKRGKVKVSIKRQFRDNTSEEEFLLTVARVYESVIKLSKSRRWSVPSLGEVFPILPYYSANYDGDPKWECVSRAVDVAVDALLGSQLSEGKRLVEDIAKRLDRVEDMVREVEILYREWYEDKKGELRQKLSSLLQEDVNSLDVSSVVSELLGRGDVTEEIVRLGVHIKRFRDILNLDSPVGKDMNFILQEMLREINTIGSKSSASEIVDVVIDIKSELERIREQAQNIL